MAGFYFYGAMNRYILDFEQQKVIEYGLDMTDLLILDYIYNSMGNPYLSHLAKDEIPYVWINHEIIKDDLPILNISEGTLRNRLSKLKQNGFILVETIAAKEFRGTQSYYAISEKTYLMRSESNERPRHFKMTSYYINNSNIYNNKLLYNYLEESQTPEKPIPKKSKGKNLYQKCMELIDDYTNYKPLVESLKIWLNMRLEIKDKPLYANQFKGLLNKLSELSSDINTQNEIVLQSVQKGWLAFYPISSGGNSQMSTEQNIKSEHYTDEELEELKRQADEIEAGGERMYF